MAGQQNYLPSFKHGFARCAAESEYPRLWDRLYGAWVPAFGVTGSTLLNFGQTRTNGTLAGATWESGCLAFSGSAQSAATGIGSLARTIGGANIAPTSVLLRFFPRSTGSRQVFLGDWDVTGNYESCVLENNHSGADFTKLCGGLNTNGYVMTSVQPMLLNAWNVGVLTAGSIATLYLNGAWQASRALSPIPTAASQALMLGRAGAYNGLYFNGLEDVLLIAARQWSPAEVALLSADPLAPFRPRRPVYASASSEPQPPLQSRAHYRRVLASTYGVSQ